LSSCSDDDDDDDNDNEDDAVIDQRRVRDDADVVGDLVDDQVVRHCGCTPNCLIPFVGTKYFEELSSLKQDDKRRLLHAVLAFSMREDTPESLRKKAKRDALRAQIF